MARNASGTYTRVSNTFTVPVLGTTIDPTHADAFWDELESETTDSWSRSGKGAALDNLSMGGFALDNVGALKLHDTDDSHTLDLVAGSNLTADRTLTFTTGDASRTWSVLGDLTIGAAFTTSGGHSLTLTTTGVTNVALPTTGTLATLAGSETLTNKTMSGTSNTFTNIGGASIRMGSDAQGDVLYFNGTNYARLPAGTSGQFLKTLGAGANPQWATPGGGGDLLAANNLSDVANASTAAFNLQVQGSWTPVLAGDSVAGTQTYSQQVGRYVRMGDLVYVMARITLTAKDGTTSGGMRITGLPFTARLLAGLSMPLSVGIAKNWDLSSGFSQFTARISSNENFIRLQQAGDNADETNLGAAAFTNDSAINVAGWYLIN